MGVDPVVKSRALFADVPWGKWGYRVGWLLRLFVFAMLTMYAMAKMLGTQFVSAGTVLDTPVRELSGIELTWVYFGYSRAYGLVIAGTQIGGGLLLLFDRTLRAGVVLLLPVMVSICLINYGYRIADDAFGMAGAITGSLLLLLLFDLPRYLAFFVGAQARPFGAPETLRKPWAWRIVRGVLVLSVVGGAWGVLSSLKAQLMPSSTFDGDWDVIDGPRGWNRLYFEPGRHLTFRTGIKLVGGTTYRLKGRRLYFDFVPQGERLDRPHALDGEVRLSSDELSLTGTLDGRPMAIRARRLRWPLPPE